MAVPVYKLPIHRDAYPEAQAGFSQAMMNNPVKHGAYLATIGHCMECHSAFSRGVIDFRTGLGKDGRALQSPMAFGFYAGIRGSDVKDIIVYLRTVPPLD